MSTTKELVNVLKDCAPGWNRTGERGLVEALNKIQNMLMMQPAYQNIAMDSTTGELPVLATTEGTYQYEINQAATGLSVDLWRVDQTLLLPPYSDSIISVIQIEYGIFPNIRQPVQSFLHNGKEYFKFFQVNSTDKGYYARSNPYLTFTIDPGDTTEDFYLLGYIRPNQILSESIQPSLPEHSHESILLPSTIKYIEARQNGNWTEFSEFMENKYKELATRSLNEGDQGIERAITRREE